MKLYSIKTGTFRLDGGTMFGVVPKSIWGKLYKSDENNMCELSMRCLLIKEDDKVILIDTGMGNKQSDKFFSFYTPDRTDSLTKSLERHNVKPEDITDLILTHLHFDHCGGATIKNSENKSELLFKNANIWLGEDQWEEAKNPNLREKHSMFKINILPLLDGKKLCLINSETQITKNITLQLYNGHTAGMIIPTITINNKKVIYGADIIPFAAHIHIPFIPSYDVKPLISFQEKEKLLDYIVKNDAYIFFEHDLNIVCSKVILTDKGYRMGDTKCDFIIK